MIPDIFYLIRLFLLAVLLNLLSLVSFADEGMWIPSILEHYNIDVMNERGLRLSAEDIYSINQASLKDAVVIFGRGCTGHIISGSGLVLSNHHCGYSSVQSLSTLENDYISNGFWALGREDELPARGLQVTLLIRIEDVTSAVLEGTGNEVIESQRKDIVESNIRKISEDAVRGTNYSAVIKPFYYGNEYYMFIYEVFKDVRLVGTPPSFIGNFGADSDNWIWPRHTGDFSLFRIYANENNEPSEYSPGNVPYSPKKFLSLSKAGYAEGDFTMILGYPGTTNQHLISPGVEMLYKNSLPYKIKLREKRMEIMDKYMKKYDHVRLQYASKYRSVSNAWKKWQGVVRGMERVDGIEVKRKQEEMFMEWVSGNDQRTDEYGRLLHEMHSLYKELDIYSLVYDYAQECIMSAEIFGFLLSLARMIAENKEKTDPEKLILKIDFLERTARFFKDYHLPVDEEILAAMLRYYYEDIDEKFHPDIYQEIHGRYKGDYLRFVRNKFRRSKLVSSAGIEDLLSSYPQKENKLRTEILKDPLYRLFMSFSSIYGEEVYARYEFVYDEIERKYRSYVKGLKEMEPERPFYPDANFTMRLTYGEIEGYEPADAVIYHFQTAIDGKIEKYRTGLPEYELSERFYELYMNKDYGRWADNDGNLYVCFTASNHTSGGNSGSPVFNANGDVIGINFDRNWEGTMNDFIYDPSQCRNISVDIRYILFIIDKFAGAGYLIEEMNIVN